jgi:hypothetical protein
MKTIRFLLVLLSLLMYAYHSMAQESLTQTIRGRIVDQVSQMPLPGANVVVSGSDPILGSSSDTEGYFQIRHVPVGRVSLQVSYMGYEPRELSHLNLLAGKELIINIALQEQVVMTEEIVIRAEQDKRLPNNELATISARTFSIEESQRFPGARNDVSRMAANFAGVRGGDDATNDIVIRGNSPRGMLWRVEGVDVPNPNHFGNMGATGGPVSMINNNLLANSDFFTGAFPAEYGNALSGVFDLQLRNGNYDQHEFLGQIGFNGFEAGAEGPINRRKRSSYLVNYRYSTLGLMNELGFGVGTGAAVPYYQDLNFKINLPGNKSGNWSLFGIGGKSSIDFLAEEAGENENLYTDGDINIYDRSATGVLGLSNTFMLSNSLYAKATLAVTGIRNTDVVDSISTETAQPVDLYRQHFHENKIFASFYINKKFSARHSLKAGAMASRFHFNMLDSAYDNSREAFITLRQFDGNSYLLQPYAQWQYRMNKDLTFNTGLHAQYLNLGNNFSLEPRLGVSWAFAPQQKLSLGYGIHTQMAPTMDYFRQVNLQDDPSLQPVYFQPNTNLAFTRSTHYVIGYDYFMTPSLRLKAEAYYQDIDDAVTEQMMSAYSLLNNGSFSSASPDSLNNAGSGYNYGLELTLEKFMDQGLYFLITGSLYDSRYRGSDGVERSTAFNSHYIFNAVGGKEFTLKLGSKKDKPRTYRLSIDGKLTTAGGQRYTAVDVAASLREGTTVYQDTRAFAQRYDPYFRADIRVAFRMEGRKVSQEWAIDVQNITNRQNPAFQRFNRNTGEVETVYQLGIWPMMQYRLEF